jgi:hypothetical protein
MSQKVNYCPRCGAGVETHRKTCPLCKEKIPEHLQDEHSLPLYPPQSEDRVSYTFATAGERKINTFFIVLTVFVVPALVVLFLDWIDPNGGFSWSLIVILTFGLIIGMTGTGLLFYKSFLALIIAWLLFISLYLWGLEQLIISRLEVSSTENNWFIPLGLPILGLTFVLFFVNYLSFKLTKLKGFHNAGTVLFSIGMFTLFLDLFISAYWTRDWIVTWGLIVFLSLTPPSIYLYFLHFVLRKRIDWRRIFHF